MSQEESAKRVYEFVVKFIVEHGYPPTLREIGAGIGANSTSSVSRWLEVLEGQGKLSFEEEKARSIRLIQHNHLVDMLKSLTTSALECEIQEAESTMKSPSDAFNLEYLKRLHALLLAEQERRNREHRAH